MHPACTINLRKQLHLDLSKTKPRCTVILLPRKRQLTDARHSLEMLSPKKCVNFYTLTVLSGTGAIFKSHRLRRLLSFHVCLRFHAVIELRDEG